jgi:hypothetical protein
MSNVSKKKYNIKKGIIMASESSSSIGTLAGLANALTVAFVILKLCKVITWSWWLVFLPTLISVGIGIVALIILILLLFTR